MSGRDERPTITEDPLEQRDRRRLRGVAALTILALLVFILIVATLAPFFGQPDIRIEPFVFGTLMGGLLLILGIEVPAWWRRR